MVFTESLLSRQRPFSWEVHKYLQVTPEGDFDFKQRIMNEKWTAVTDALPNGHLMAVKFHEVLNNHLEACYSWKRVRRKSNDKPWITDGIRRQMKRRKAIFRREGRSEHWKRLDKSIKKLLNFRKSKYNMNQKTKLENSGNTSQWYNVSKFLATDEATSRWNITDLEPNQSPEELAKNLSTHFSEITTRMQG